MHVTKSMSPKEDTEMKIGFVSPCNGAILDTCTGLGYTAILAAKTADEVYTFEKDINIIEIQKLNPWSEELFSNKKIKRFHGDIFQRIKKLDTGKFARVIHDPPRYALAPELYSNEFYDQLYRVITKKGILYHYTGEPGRKKGADIKVGVIKKLTYAGFIEIKRVFNGLVALK
jgi:hypothetical protein